MLRRVFINKVANINIYERALLAVLYTSVEAFIAAACLIGGIPVLFDPSSFAPLVVHPFGLSVIYSWAAGMVSGGTLTLFGIILDNYRVERMGAILLASVAFAFSVALVTALPHSLIALITYVLLCLALLARYYVLGKLIAFENKKVDRLRRHILENEKE